MKTRSSSSSGDLVPFVKSRRKKSHGLAVVNRPPPSSRRSKTGTDDTNHRVYASKGFRLPKGWTVEESPRSNSYHIDKFYVERETGKRLRSLVSVERYLKQSNKNHKDQQLVLLQHDHVPSKDFNLPDGWIVEEKPRRNSTRIDRLYIEEGTGKKFRSLPAVETYLNGTVDDSMVHDSGQLLILAKPDGAEFESVDIDPNIPEKVKWVLTGPGGNMFSAHVNGSDVSSSVKQTWSEAFVSLIQEQL